MSENTQRMLAAVLGQTGRENFKAWGRGCFKRSAELQAVYPNAEACAGYMLAIAEGRVRHHTAESMPLPSMADMNAALAEAMAAEAPLADPAAQQDRTAYRASPALRAEFRAEEHYLAYRRAERAGVIRVAARHEGATPERPAAVR